MRYCNNIIVLRKKLFSFIFLLPVSVFLLFSSFSFSGENEKTNTKDTVSAIVMYGHHLLFEHIDYMSESEIIAYRDSLISIRTKPAGLVKQINLFLGIKYMSQEQMVHLIDSLFELDSIPYPLINQINLYIANSTVEGQEENPDSDIEVSIPCFAGEDTSVFPANIFYQDWNTEIPHPYTKSITESDSVIYLLLQGTKKLGKFVPPKKGVLTSEFGWREGSWHKGIDIDLEVWDSVVTAFPGMVRVAKTFGGYGRVVVVRHFNGLETLYAHLHRIKVKPGQIVNAGDLIGLGGSSGRSTGSHLHFECRFKGEPLNPQMFIDFKTHEITTDTLVIKKTDFGYAAFPNGAKFHIVKRGDYLHKIAQMYGTTTSKLCELNGIRKNKTLIVGQQIRII
jgi:murein DD-endopeptidase MepM/ murein hydrolase activator NlpD